MNESIFNLFFLKKHANLKLNQIYIYCNWEWHKQWKYFVDKHDCLKTYNLYKCNAHYVNEWLFKKNINFHHNIWSWVKNRHCKGFLKLTTRFENYKKIGFS
jgi:hypothetical protein